MGAEPFEFADNALVMSRCSWKLDVAARWCRMVAMHCWLPDHGGHAVQRPDSVCHPVLPSRHLSLVIARGIFLTLREN
jgi:hypothetical protein